jgi:excinuclease ABC subunit A
MLKKDISTFDPRQFIIIKGARTNNLKNIDVAIPKKKLVVITGLSGSGKSSLAFDTLFADGQRRYVESLSAYARQFLGRMTKPDVDYIKGIAPAIAIEQKVNTRSPRSTVGTSTEIYEYLKLLFARIGKTYSPVSGNIVECHTVSGVTGFIMGLPPGTNVLICARFRKNNHDRTLKDQLSVLLQQGYSRVILNGVVYRIEEMLQKESYASDEMFVVIDRIVVKVEDADLRARIADSVQTAFYEGHGICVVETEVGGKKERNTFSNKFEADGIIFEEPSVNLFSFNNPYGACKKCEGFGSIIGIDPDLVIPNKSLSVFEEAIVCWKGEKMSEWKDALVRNAYKFNFPIHKPVYELTPQQYELLWTGNKYFAGLNEFFRHVEEQTYKIQYRVLLSRYRGKTTCPDCSGTRLRQDAGYVRVGGKSISELVLLPVKDTLSFFRSLQLSEYETRVVERILVEIKNRLQYLINVGLGYLTLNRLSNSLSGGESQRINLATSLGSTLVGSLYILDEPSIGLHPRDTHMLIGVLKQLRDDGNTVVVVEHDEEIIRAADEIIDIGPHAGYNGGEVVFQGNFSWLVASDRGLTAKYMSGNMAIPVPADRRKWNDYIEITNAGENNLKNISVRFPLNVLTLVTGVSGSGKTSLVRHILYPALSKLKGGYGGRTGKYGRIEGDVHRFSHVEMVDQNPIGRSSRSNPATYVKAYDDIRSLFSDQKLAQIRGYKPGYFSFNVEGGRCEDCEGEGFVKIEMQFMADIFLRCESCGGKRFKEEVLDVKYMDKDISDILNMTVDQAIGFFGEEKSASSVNNRIIGKLKPLRDVGLGYLRLGQSSSTLSGGEAQRVKLALFLSKGVEESPSVFIFDEPTTGLHVHDISNLLRAFDALIEKGHSVIVVEHNPDVIKYADWVIDLGPEGGEEGGHLVYEGTPEGLVNCKGSYTGKFLSKKIP